LYYEAVKKGLLYGPEVFFNKFRHSDLLTANFTDIPNKQFYNLFFEANKGLILDHYKNADWDIKEADNLIDQFHGLYFEGDSKFRGARHI